MADKMPIVAFTPASIDACALYRQFIPHLNIPKSRFVFSPGHLQMQEFAEASVVAVQRQVTINNYVAIKEMKKVGMKLSYDLDDNLWSVPSYNPSYRIFKAPGTQEAFYQCANICDVVTVSTRGLASAVKSAFRNLQPEVVVVPNAVDFNLMRPAVTSREDGRVVVGWAGSNTHREDVQDAWSVLPEVLARHPEVHFEVVGEAPPKELQGHPRVRVRRWVPVGEFAGRFSTWGWDIALAPLEDNRFNASKSNLKALEASAVGAACLMSHVQPYEEFCALGGEELRWLLCTTRFQWKEKLETLIVDVARRQALVSRMQSVARNFFDIAVLKENWMKVFRDICPN